MLSETITAKGLKSRVIRVGGGKQKIVLLHGWGGEATRFEEVALRLYEASGGDREILLLDMPGFGESENLPEGGWTTEEFADWLEEMLGALKIKKPIFYGHSFGCRVIVRFLLRHSEWKEKVVLTGAAGIKWDPTWREKASLFCSKNFSAAKKVMPQKMQKFVVTKVFKARDWGDVTPERKATLKKVLAEDDFRDLLPQISASTLLIWGRDDQITPLKSGEVYATNLPNAQLKVLEEGRHGVHLTHAKDVVELVDGFLR